MSSLAASVTLEDVFAVVEAKRVPLAPELAGYLTLEIADGTDAGSGDVDPKAVFISEEGTVAVVRRRSEREPTTGEAEASLRALLTKLLEASGSGTPALTTAAKRKPGNGLPALIEELEAALIPVNRAAGRRALARLAREVKRVLLGVGRNASLPVQGRPSSEPRPAVGAAPHARPLLRKREEEPKATETRTSSDAKPNTARRAGSFGDEAATTKRPNELSELASTIDAAEGGPSGGPDSTGAAHRAATNADVRPPPGGASRTPPPAAARSVSGLPPPPVKSASGRPAPPPPPKREPASPAAVVLSEVRPESDGRALVGGDTVDSLLGAFAVSNAHEDRQMARELKAIAGLSPTPPPPDARTLAELTKDIGKDLPKRLEPTIDGDGVEALLALADASGAAPPPQKLGDAPPPAAAASVPPASPVMAPVANARAAMPEAAALRSAPSATARRRSAAERPRAPKTGMAMLVFALVVLAAGTGAVWKFAPQVFTGKKRTAAPPPVVSTALPPKCKVALVLTDVPANAEVLLRVGQAPVDVERMPVGTRLELVATAEGYAPRRAVIKGESSWDKGPDGKPRLEVPIQLDPSKAKPGAVDPWPTAEPGSQVGGSGSPGTLRVVSNVRGAEVWLLAGLAPEARIDQLRCDGDIDVLFAGPPALRKRLHVSDKEVESAPADADGNKVVTISAK